MDVQQLNGPLDLLLATLDQGPRSGTSVTIHPLAHPGQTGFLHQGETDERLARVIRGILRGRL